MRINKSIVFTYTLSALVFATVAFSVTSLWRSNGRTTFNQAEQKIKDIGSQPHSAEIASAPLEEQPQESVERQTKDTVTPIDVTHKVTIIDELQPNEYLEKSLSTLMQRINASDTELQHAILGSNEDYLGLRRDLLRAIDLDPLLIDRLLDLFEENPDSVLGRELAAVLAETGSPEAQTLALDIATNASLYAIEERAAALLMVSEMDSITSETRDGLLANIQAETESDLTQFSLMALNNAPSTPEDYENVHRVLQETLYTDDPHVRRHATYQIGEWATSNEDLAPLRAMAIEEPDFNARVRAVMSLGSSNFKSTENKDTLYSVVENDEDPIVRFKAWEALGSFPLSDMEKSDYNELGQRIRLDVQAFEASMSEE